MLNLVDPAVIASVLRMTAGKRSAPHWERVSVYFDVGEPARGPVWMMQHWPRFCCLTTVVFLGACAVGEDSAGDNFTFGAGGNDDDSVTGGPGPTGGPADGTADETMDGGGDGDDDDDGNADGVACIDGDGDDYGDGCAAGGDCDDTNPEINPGVGESCNGVDDNCDDMVDNGCECPDDGVSGSCNSPTDLGSIEVGGSETSVVGTVPQEGSVDWYTISFPAPMRPGEGTPTIGFSINTGDAFAFDVVDNQCDAQGATCTTGGTGGAAVGLTSWSFVDDDPGCCAPPMDSMVPWPNQIYVRVYRTTMGASCDTYQLQASR